MEFLRKLFSRPAAASAAEPPPAQPWLFHPRSIDPDARPRAQHYVFVHRALRDIFFTDPMQAASVLMAPEAGRILANLWAEVAANEGEPALPAHGLEVRVSMDLIADAIWPRTRVFVTLPAPTAPAEAYCVAMVVDSKDGVSPSLAEFYTLEAGAPDGATPLAFMCGWTGDGSHLNYGTRSFDGGIDFEREVRAMRKA